MTPPRCDQGVYKLGIMEKHGSYYSGFTVVAYVPLQAADKGALVLDFFV